MPRPSGKRSELERWLAEHAPARIGEAELAEIRSALAPISQSYLTRLLRECGRPLDPMVEGVRQENLAALEASLLAMSDEYERSDRARQAAVRRLVITAKDHARLSLSAAKDDPSRFQMKQEAILWLTTWLENPLVFAEWVRIRRQA